MKLFNKNILTIILTAAIFAGFINGCTSPVDVPASREKTEKWRDGSGVFEIDLPSNDLGYILKNNSTTITIKIKNLTDKALVFDNFTVKSDPDLIKVNEGKPVTLAPKGSDGSEASVPVTFSALRFGVFGDTVRFNDYFSPNLAIKATCPAVYINDVNFSAANINEKAFKSVTINNSGDKPIRVKSYSFENNTDNVFRMETIITGVEIPAGQSKNFILSFTPLNKQQYTNRIIFGIESDYTDIVDTDSFLSGTGR